MNIPPIEYKGLWEEILTHADNFAGHQVRVIVLPKIVLPKKEHAPHKYQSTLDALDELDRSPWTS